MGVFGTGGIHQIAFPEEGLEDLHLKIGPLVAHIHPLFQNHAALPVHANAQITKLRPGEDHHGQVHTGGGEAAAQVTGGDAFDGQGAALAEDGQGAHEEDPVQQGQRAENAHGNDLRVAVTLHDQLAGEHILADGHHQSNLFPVGKAGGGVAVDQRAAYHIADPGFDAGLEVGAGEGGFAADLTGQGQGEIQRFHRIVKAGQQGNFHHKGVDLGIRIPLGAQHIRQGVAEHQLIVAGDAVETAQIHQHDLRVYGTFVSPDGSAADGYVGSCFGQGEGQAGCGGVQMKPDGGRNLTAAVCADIDDGADIGGRGLGGNRNGQQTQAEYE